MTKKPIEDISEISPAVLSKLHAENTERPRKVLLSSIHTATDHFQARLTGLLQDTKEAIRDGITHKHKLPPILVIGSVNQPVVVDGHHRLQVYREMQTQPNQKVAVEWVDGDFQTAQRDVLKRNRAASKHLGTDERTTWAWHSLCEDAAAGKLFVDDGTGTFAETVNEMMTTFTLKKRATQNLRREIKSLFAHLKFNQEELIKVLSNELSDLKKKRWMYPVRQTLQDYYDGVERPLPDMKDQEERMVCEIMERWNKYMKPGWLTEPKYSDAVSEAIERMSSNHTKSIMFQHFFGVVSEDTLDAALEERDDIRGLEAADDGYPF